MTKLKYQRVIIEAPKLESANATFVALLNEVLKWAEANGIQPQQAAHFVEGFKRTAGES